VVAELIRATKHDAPPRSQDAALRHRPEHPGASAGRVRRLCPCHPG
jgi:hypothetical protein